MATAASGESKATFRQTLAAPGLAAQAAGDAIRDRLQRVDALQQQGKIDEAVKELLEVSAIYVQRSAPVKAVAVLRQAVRLKPDNSEVRVAYGDVLMQLRMVEDAVREYSTACAQLETHGRYGEWLDVLRRVMTLDADNLAGRLQLAEALSRAGMTVEAAGQFRTLAELLLERGETEDWEQVAERLLYHDEADATTAHDLALHYVRTGRHAEALGKLALCYDVVPNDAELLDLIIDTLQMLGQHEKAAVICRELVRTCRRNGLQDPANTALQRLYFLDPDDPEAREHVGVLRGSMEAGFVIELQSGGVGPPQRAAPPRPVAAARTVPAAGDPDDFNDAERTRAAVPPKRPSAPRAPEPPPVSGDAGPPPVPMSSAVAGPLRARSSDSYVADAPAAPPVIPAPLRRAAAPAALPGRQFSSTSAFQGRPGALPMPAAGGGPAHAGPAGPSVQPTTLQNSGVSEPPPMPGSAAAAPRRPAVAAAPAVRRIDRSTVQDFGAGGADWDAPTTRGSFGPARSPSAFPATSSVPALEALALSLDAADDGEEPVREERDDEEAGFDVEERTLVDGNKNLLHGAPPVASEVPDFVMPAGAAPSAPSAATAAPIASARRRSHSLPRPRLARRPGTSSELPTTLRDISKDMNTLEFFIERGFYESAVALWDALEKRHPNSAEIRVYRSRIERMPKAGHDDASG
ncbi:MAG: hypothetical protein EXR79_05170 [Myxococcales bacterium]|nr:hypothetical protein [Myxococcales bacterium]